MLLIKAAESGWDFGSRWFADQKTLATIETANIAPIDLNSYLCYNMDVLHYLYEVTGCLQFKQSFIFYV